ncbi:MAG TPA: alpha/beta hydrolase [Acidimicrobiales bacterium]|nr:alpha/beta hydrolase [Acidimicrobiales bacterium]
MSSARRRLVTTAGAAAAAAVGAAAVGAAAANPAVRAEAHRLRGFIRPLDVTAGPPVPPPLPPGRVVFLEGVGELFFRDTGGTGPAALLLHGWGATADINFFQVYFALSDAYRVIALDHRDHGRGLRVGSPFRLEDCADDAACLLATLGVDRAFVLGYSMGGPIALLLARRHRERCAGLVLEATALEFREGLKERALWRSLSLLEAGLRHGSGDGVVQRVLRAAVDEEPSLEAYRSWLAAEFRRADVRGIVEAGEALSTYDARPWAASLHLPAAVVLTTVDRLVPPRKQRALAAALDARIFELHGDHDVPITGGAALGQVTRAALDHVAGLAELASPERHVARPTAASRRRRAGQH